MKMKYFLALLVILLSSAAVFADEPTKSEWERSAALGFNLTEGNSDTSLTNLAIKFVKDTVDRVWRFEFEESYGETDDTANVDYTKGHAEIKELVNKRLYFGGGVKALRDDIADVNYRVTPFGVIGYFLYRDAPYDLSIEVGPAYVFEETGGIEDDYFAPRFGQRFEWPISENAKFYQKADLTLQVDETENYLVEAEAGLESTVIGDISLVATVKDTYDNRPAEGRKSNDIQLITGLQMKF